MSSTPAEAPPPLDPGHGEREAWIRQAAAFVQAELDGLEGAPTLGPQGAELEHLLHQLPRGVPETAISLSEALDRIGRAAKLGMQPATPGYLAYIPGGGVFAAALASFISLALNRYVGLAAASPGMVRFEQDVIKLFASELGLPEGSGGILTSGGSMANLSAIVAARVQAFGEDADFSRATLYLSAEAHRSMAKAARIAGIPAENLRPVAVDSAFRLDSVSLASMVAEDRADGYRPFFVAGTAGTTNTGAIDPLEEIAELCEREGLWFHVDGAYGGMFVLTAEGKELLRGMGRADSITLDPHKGLFLPYGCGALVVRRVATLLRSHAEKASYLQDLTHEADEPSPAELGPELSRNDRGILVWLPLALHGLEAFRAALSEKLELARYFCRALQDLPVEIAVEPELSIVAFRLPRAPGESLADWNRRNRAWLERINNRRRIHLSSTLILAPEGEVFTLRVCILSFRTHGKRVELALKEVADCIAEE